MHHQKKKNSGSEHCRKLQMKQDWQRADNCSSWIAGYVGAQYTVLLKFQRKRISVRKVVTEAPGNRIGFPDVLVSSMLMVAGSRWRPRGTSPGTLSEEVRGRYACCQPFTFLLRMVFCPSCLVLPCIAVIVNWS